MPFGRKQRAITQVDMLLAEKVRRFRKQRALTLQQVADFLVISQQQVQKYETGKNRISASTLLSLATLFDVPIGAFFEFETNAGEGGEFGADSPDP